MSKAGGHKTVQTLIAPRKDLSKKDKESSSSEKSSKLTKRTHSDVETSDHSDHSMNISVEYIELTKDLQEIKSALKDNTKKEDLTNALKDLVKQADIEDIVTNIVQKLLTNFKIEIKKEVDEKFSTIIQKQAEEIEKLKADIVRINKKCIDQNVDSNNLSKELEFISNRTEEAISMSNYNEQYSRKCNLKIINFKAENDNNLRDNFVKMVKDDLNLEIDKRDIVAIHRLRTNRAGVPPVIVKVINSDVKTQIMRRKKQTKGGVRLFDDITFKNQDLLRRVKKHKDITAAYYFNCAVYGRTKDGLQIRFDISDDINGKIDYETRNK